MLKNAETARATTQVMIGKTLVATEPGLHQKSTSSSLSFQILILQGIGNRAASIPATMNSEDWPRSQTHQPFEDRRISIQEAGGTEDHKISGGGPESFALRCYDSDRGGGICGAYSADFAENP